MPALLPSSPQPPSRRSRLQITFIIIVMLLMTFFGLGLHSYDYSSSSLLQSTTKKTNSIRKQTTKPKPTSSPKPDQYDEYKAFEPVYTREELLKFKQSPIENPIATVVLTMDCSLYSEWQTAIAIGSLNRMRLMYPDQRYKIVRLISCSQGEAGISPSVKGLADETYVSDNVGDSYCCDPVKGFSYPPLNKPHAILNWLSKHGTELPDDHEIIIVDTDFLFLRPFQFGMAKPHQPAASNKYFMGSDWLFKENSEVKKFCHGKCNKPSANDVALYYDVGAPYYILAGDLRDLVPLWYSITDEIVQHSNPKVAWSMPGGWICEVHLNHNNDNRFLLIIVTKLFFNFVNTIEL